MSHSKLPWRIEEWDEDSPEHLKKYGLVYGDYMDVAYVTGEIIDKVDKSQISDNAAFIVKAVNNHYKLLEAAKAAYRRLLFLGHYDGRITAEGQQELANLRDSIADAMGIDPEEIQNDFEDAAYIKKYCKEAEQ